MSLPGFNTSVTIKRVGQTGHEADGTPRVELTTVWVGKCHYQPESKISVNQLYTDTGQAAEARYLFFIPYLTGSKQPWIADLVEADNIQFQVDEVIREGLHHHLILGAKRVDR